MEKQHTLEKALDAINESFKDGIIIFYESDTTASSGTNPGLGSQSNP